MQVKSANFVVSAARPEQYPTSDIPEVALVGRSNVGKSSLLNALTGRKGLAKVGGTPGKTQLVNFFNINGDMHLVDLPGYGFAKVSKEQKLQWAQVINSYLTGRPQLSVICLLVDSRHEPNGDDLTMMDWIRTADIPCIIVATKVDKLGKSQVSNHLAAIRETLDLNTDTPIVPFSSQNAQGKQELLGVMGAMLELQ